ncbi:uncharacterized protein LOC128218035 isoform X2 [Mya arenaria]|nr:uncharacterized protein LOC128218035 isoform X2 [Mya arenaria]
MDGEPVQMLRPGDIKTEPTDAPEMFLGPLDIKQEIDPDSTTGNAPKKKGRPKKPKELKQEKITEHGTVKKKRKVDRFKGMPEEEVAKRLLPDHLAPNLDIVIVGINPGLYAAFVGHHYAGPGNHFWKCMYLSGLIPEPMNAMQDFKLLEYGIGFTNIVARTTRGSADLTRKEIKEGAQLLTEKLLNYKPKIAVFNGKGIYEVFVGHKNFYFGKQPEPLPGTETAVYVMPSSSARCSQLPRAVDKVPFYEALKKFRDHLNGKLPDLQDSEITFPDLVLQTAVKKEPKEESNEVYPGEMSSHGDMGQMPGDTDQYLASLDQQLAQFTQGSYQVIPHSQTEPQQQHQQQQQQQQQHHHQQQQQHHQQQQQYQQQQQQQSYTSMQQSRSPEVNQNSQVPATSSVSTSSSHFQPQGSVCDSQMHQVKVKEEPVDHDDSPCQSSSSQPNTISIGQFEVYNQPNSTQYDSHLTNFLSGLHGMVNQVAGPNQGQSMYGLVTHSGVTAGAPLQFNDALRDIVREGSSDSDQRPAMSDFTSACEAISTDTISSQQDSSLTGKGKAAKTSKPRKRKSKSNEEPVPELSPSTRQSPLQQQMNGSPPSQLPPMTSFSAVPPFQPFAPHMPYFGQPMPTYANSHHSQLPPMPSLHMGQGHFPGQYNPMGNNGFPMLPYMPPGAMNMPGYSNGMLGKQQNQAQNLSMEKKNSE